MTPEVFCGTLLVSVLVLVAVFPSRFVAVVMLALAALVAVLGESGWGRLSYPDVLWKPATLVFGLSLLTAMTQRTALVPWLGLRLVSRSQAYPFRLLLGFCALELLLCFLLNNLLATIVVTSLTLVVVRKLKMNIVPFLLAEAVCGGLGGVLTLTTSPTAVVFAALGGFSYLEIAAAGGPFVLVGGAVSLLLIYLVYRSTFMLLPARERDILERRLERFDPQAVLTEQRLLHPSWFILLLTLGGLAMVSMMSLPAVWDPTWIVLGGAGLTLLLWSSDTREALTRVEWSLVAYLIGMGLLLNAPEVTSVLEVARGTFYSLPVAGWMVPWAELLLASLLAGLVGTVQSVLVLGTLLQEPHVVEGVQSLDTHWWAVLFGAATGGMLPPVGGGVLIALWEAVRQGPEEKRWAQLVGMLVLLWVVLTVLACGYVLLLDRASPVVMYSLGAVAWGGLVAFIAWGLLRRNPAKT